MNNEKFDPKIDLMFADPSGTEYQIMEERIADAEFLSQKSHKNRMEYKVRVLKRGEHALNKARIGEERWVHVSTMKGMDLRVL